jgi:regulator of sigma E protease
MDILVSILAFVVAISILVAVHEFGHFWVARKLGVKVLRFSIGFGKPLLKHVGKDGTEYVISAIPLGGYVKMLGEYGDAQLSEEEKTQAHNNKSVYVRFAISLAGPAFNFLFAILAYWLVFTIGVEGTKPVIGTVTEASPAAVAGLKTNDEIIEINGKKTPIWNVALQAMIPSIIDKQNINIKVSDGYGGSRSLTLILPETSDELEPNKLFTTLGFQPWRPPIKPTIGLVVDGDPAAKAGMLEGDKIIALDQLQVIDWSDLVEYVTKRPNTDINVLVERDGIEHKLLIHTKSKMVNDKPVGKMGIAPKEYGEYPEEMKVLYQYPLLASLGKSLENTVHYSLFTLKMMGKIITGDVSIKNLSGPINIAIIAGYSASAGWARFFDFLAIVSISLGVLNLLPIPILDGGHLLYYLIEMVKGSPVSEQIMEIGQRIGIVLLLMLMSIAFFNDLSRIFG